jgi:hypothetical protein
MAMVKTILQITKVKVELLSEIADSFNNLPETTHADGKYRLRKYSRAKATQTGFGLGSILTLEDNEFLQGEKYNKHQGGMVRKFENIDEEVVNSDALHKMVEVFFSACEIKGDQEFDIHQMRVKCLGGATQLSPEGWHQDGYDHIAMIGVNRNNIIGGEIMLSTSKVEAPFLQAVIDTGTLVIVDDSYLWHNGRSIQPIDDNQPAWMDVMVFTMKRQS